jgi:regulator of sigma E protease
MLGGIIMNVLVAFVVYAFVLMIWGEKKVPTASMKYGVHIVDSTMYKMGLRNGDKILEIDGKEVTDYEKLRRKLLLGSLVTVDRNGQKVNLTLDENLIGQLVENKDKSAEGFVLARKPAIAFLVPDTSKVYKAGLRKDDQIVAVDSGRITFYDELQNQLQANKGKTVQLAVLRNGNEVSFPVSVSEEGKIGFVPYGYDLQQMDSLGWVKLNVTKYGFFAAFPAGVRKAGEELSFYVAQFKKILNPKTGAYKGVGGFKGMSKLFNKYQWDWEHFWTMTAFLSIVLAFMNLLPIPALDGGHVVFTLYEMIFRRKPNEKFLEYAQLVGMVLLLGLMLYANGNDWFGWGK